MQEKILVREVKDIVNRAAENCTTWIDDGPGTIGGGHTTCAFCGKNTHWNDTKNHNDDCLINELKRIERAEIVED